MGAGRSRAGLRKGLRVGALALVVAMALVAAPASASAASPVLEFVPSGGSFPIPFTSDGGEVSARLAEFDPIVNCDDSKGEGEITGPRSTLSSYVFTGCVAEGGSENGNACQSEGADTGEITTGTIAADLVYLNQAKHEAAMLLNPGKGVYMDFECGGETVKASGPFLSPVTPVNQLAASFTAILERDGASQLPSVYEGPNGEKLEAIPMGQKGTDPPDMTGVGLTFSIQPSVPLTIRSVNTAELEAKQREEEAAAAKKREEEAAAAAAAAAKKRQEEQAAADAAAAAKRLQEEEAKAREERQRLNRLRSKGLTQCRQKASAKQGRVRCEKRVKKRFGGQGAKKRPAA